jgi:guanine nucleotide-binding protein G(i) subunit alpha
MAENMAFFDRIINLKWFQQTAIVILFNHISILKRKLTLSPLCDHFPEFGGGVDLDEARKFLTESFVRLNRSKGRGVYCHFTDIDDATIFQHVMVSLKDIIVHSNVRSSVIQEGMGFSSTRKGVLYPQN